MHLAWFKPPLGRAGTCHPRSNLRESRVTVAEHFSLEVRKPLLDSSAHSTVQV